MQILLTLSPVDALALSLLGVMMVTIIALASLVVSMKRNIVQEKKKEELFRGLEDIWDEEEQVDGASTSAPKQEWEKDADWWKGERS